MVKIVKEHSCPILFRSKETAVQQTNEGKWYLVNYGITTNIAFGILFFLYIGEYLGGDAGGQKKETAGYDMG